MCSANGKSIGHRMRRQRRQHGNSSTRSVAAETLGDDDQIYVNQLDSPSSYEASPETEETGKKSPSLTEDFGSSRSHGAQSKHNRALTSRDRSKKRKAEMLATREWKAKRLKGFYNNDYRQLLNEFICDTVSLVAPEEYDRLPQTQIGVTTWTSKEKDSFFTALARLGKNDVQAIALRIGSKSEIEVQEYIHLLHQGMLEKSLNEPRQQLLGLWDTPTALQVSQECCEQLELAADVLASRQERYEENEEQKRWGEFWLLTSSSGDLVEERLLGVEDASPELQKLLLAVDLLKIRSWLELSNHIFMNPAAPREENWRYLAEPGEEPGIRATAFADFYRLTVSVTKRLVSASIFCASSRLRAMDSAFRLSDFIKSADVEAAAKIIGLKVNSQQFWTNCARRCKLDVMKQVSAEFVDHPPMDYDDVESFMGSKMTRRQSSIYGGEAYVASPSDIASHPSSANPVLSSNPYTEGEFKSKNDYMDGIPRDLASEYMQEFVLTSNRPMDPSDPEFEHPHIPGERLRKKLRYKTDLIQAQDEYVEAIDLQASIVEEQKLWGILEQDPPFNVDPANMPLPKRPIQDRKDADELGNWRENIQFRSLWETLDSPIPADAFSSAALRQKKHEKEPVEQSIHDSGSGVGDDSDEIKSWENEEASIDEKDGQDDEDGRDEEDEDEGDRSVPSDN